MIRDKKSIIYLCAGLLVVGLLFGFIEYLHPYHFTQDDNLAQFLPVMLLGMKQMFSGELPVLNMHQYMGVQILEIGTYALLYPVSIVSYTLAHFAFGNDFLFMELFVLFHLLLGFVFFFLLVDRKIKRPGLGMLASLAWTFSGYGLIASSNWYYVAPSIAFLPLLFILLERCIEKPTSGRFSILGAILGLYFYAGNAQYFTYSLIFMILYSVLLCLKEKREGLAIARGTICAFIVMLIIIMPLAFAQMQIAKNSPRGHESTLNYFLSLPSSLYEIVSGSLFVYPMAKSTSSFAYAPSSFTHIYYSGALFSILFFTSIIFYLRRDKMKMFKESPLMTLGLVSILLSMGLFGVIYTLGAFIPVIKNFSYPFKITFYVNFFCIMAGSIFAGEMLQRMDNKKAKRLVIAAGALFIILLSYHVYISAGIAWSYYGDKLPLQTEKYKELDLERGRAISVFTNSTHNPRILKNANSSFSFSQAYFLPQNFATYFGVDHIAGYEPFVDSLTADKIPITRYGLADVKLNTSALEEYGVRWVFIDVESIVFHPELSNYSKIYEEDGLAIVELDGAKSYVFSGGENIDYEKNSRGLEFSTDFNTEKSVTINLLYKDNYVAKIDGIRSELDRDEIGRMILQVSEGEHQIELHYSPKGMYVGALGSLVLIILSGAYVFVRRKGKIVEIEEKTYVFGEKYYLKAVSFVRRYWIIVVILLVILLAFIYFRTLTSADNIESVLYEQTHLDINIDKIAINPFSGKMTIKNVSRVEDERIVFSSDMLVLDASYISSLKKTFGMRRPSVVFSNIEASNSIFVINDESGEGVCQQKMKLAVPELGSRIVAEKLIINGAEFKPFNKFFLNFEDADVVIVDGEIEQSAKINANISVQQYVSGSIDIDSDADIFEREICIKLPVDEKNSLYEDNSN